MVVYIYPHERADALEAYKDWLSPKQVEQIENAGEDKVVRLIRQRSHTVINIE